MVKYSLKFYAPAVLYILLILTLSSLNQRLVQNLSWGLEDFLLHATEYHLFGLTLIWAVYRDKPKHEYRNSFRVAMGVGTLVAMGDEFYQSFIPSRYSSMEDVVADVFGMLLSTITFSLMMKISALEKLRQHA